MIMRLSMVLVVFKEVHEDLMQVLVKPPIMMVKAQMMVKQEVMMKTMIKCLVIQ